MSIKKTIIGIGVLFSLTALVISDAAVYAAPPDEKGKDRQAKRKKSPAVERSLIPPSQRKNKVKRPAHHDRAREELRSGRIISLGVIRRSIRKNFKGRILDVRLIEPRQSGRPYMYDLKLLQGDGKLVFIRVNARNGRIVNVKGKEKRKK